MVCRVDGPRRVNTLIELHGAKSPNSIKAATEHQGKGLGTQLMRHCIAMAEEAQLLIYLAPSSSAYSFYHRFRFEDVGYFDMDLSYWAGVEAMECLGLMCKLKS